MKNTDKEKCTYSGYRIAFDGKDKWSFGIDHVIIYYVIVFGVDNSSSCRADNLKNNFLVLCEGDTFGINERFGAPEKTFSINFSKANTTFCLSLHYNADNYYLFVNRKEIFTFKVIECYWV